MSVDGWLKVDNTFCSADLYVVSKFVKKLMKFSVVSSTCHVMSVVDDGEAIIVKSC